MDCIRFNEPPVVGEELSFIAEAIKKKRLAGDYEFTIKCQKWFDKHLKCSESLMTPSCTQALEMAAILIDIKPGDEVIMPSYTFVSTANAFVLRGAKIVFVDIRQDTMNIDETLVEAAVTGKTKAIVTVHYAGVGCEMDTIMDIAKRHNIFVIEDAAQGMMSTYKGKPLGAIGHLGAYSFHETKNYTSGGEGGLLIINDDRLKERAEIIRDKGTNRRQFLHGMTDKYSWLDIGSSFLLNDISAAFLWAQLNKADEINNNRHASWSLYFNGLKMLQEKGFLELPVIPKECIHNAHMFYIKVKDLHERIKLLEYLKTNNVHAVFHYIPLHSAQAGVKFGRFNGEDLFTTKESERVVRLPLYYKLEAEKINYIIDLINKFYISLQ
jgi:dTDP-4-amino-4,6-dideoxygalactose transaminase